MNLEQEIKGWDGKSADDIGDIYFRHHQETSFVSELIRFIQEKPLQKGATWLLKRHLENREGLDQGIVSAVYQMVKSLEHWESKLHILQCIPYLPIPKGQRNRVETFLRECLEENAKFVRAWAYNGFYELAVQYPEYREEAQQLFKHAMNDEPPSVKARVRNILKVGFK